MSNTTSRIAAAVAVTGLVFGGATLPSVADTAPGGSGPRDGAPQGGHLTARDAGATLGSWGLDSWRGARVVPKRLRWQKSCGTDLPGSRRSVLREHRQAAIDSRVTVADRPAAARTLSRRAAQWVESCQQQFPERSQVMTDFRVRSEAGGARTYGTHVRSGGHAAKLEYVVVARSGRAAEVSTFRVLASDTAPKRTVRALARRTVARLADAR